MDVWGHRVNSPTALRPGAVNRLANTARLDSYSMMVYGILIEVRTLIGPVIVLLAMVWFWTHPEAAGGLGALMQAAWYGPILALWNGPVQFAWNAVPPTLRVLILIAVVVLVLSGPARRRGMLG